LLYGNSVFEEIVFREELDSIADKNPGLRIVQVLSDPLAGWRGKTGRISKDLVAEVITDYLERRFYISGPPKMVIALDEQLQTLHIPDEQLVRDSFTGYD
jgi:NAD(P)H-flavin reductase